MGHACDKLIAENPFLYQKYEEYLMCRSVQFVTFRKPDGPKGEREKLVTAIWATGFTKFPLAGGLEDQRYLDMRLFAAFLKGDQQGSLRQLSH